MKPIADSEVPSSWRREGVLWVPHTQAKPPETNWATFAWAVQHLTILAGLAVGLGAIALYTYAAQEQIPLRFHHGELAHLLPWFTAAGGAIILAPVFLFVAIGVYSHSTIGNPSETLQQHLSAIRWRGVASPFWSGALTITVAFGLPTFWAIGLYVARARGHQSADSAYALSAFALVLLSILLYKQARAVSWLAWPFQYLIPLALCIGISVWPIRSLFLSSASQALVGSGFAALTVAITGLSVMGAHRVWRSGLPKLIILVFSAIALLFLTTPIGPRGAQHALALLGLGGNISFVYALRASGPEVDATKRKPLLILAGLVIDTGDQMYVRTCDSDGRIRILDWQQVSEFQRRPGNFQCPNLNNSGTPSRQGIKEID